MALSSRRQARQFAVQAMYQWQMAGIDLLDIEKQFFEDFDLTTADEKYFCQLLYGIPEKSSVLDEALKPFLDRDIKSLGPVELAILRIGAYELMDCPEVPYKVVINEGVDLAKTFGASGAHKYVNGVLDKLAKKLRVIQIK